MKLPSRSMLLATLLLAPLAACSDESQAAEPASGSAAKAWNDARASALETLGHVRDGLAKGLEDAQSEWDEHSGEWGRELEAQMSAMAEAIKQLSAEGRAKTAQAAKELEQARAELAKILERGGRAAAEESAEQSEALRSRLEKLERRLREMAQPEDEVRPK